MELQDEKLKKAAKELVANRRGLMVHIVCWLVISLVIIIAVPEKALGVRAGFCVLGFWGIAVAIHAVSVAVRNAKLRGINKASSYQRAVDREYEKLKSGRGK